MPFEVPKGWEWCKLEALVGELRYGTSEKSAQTGSVAVLRMGNITNIGTIDYCNLVYTSSEEDIKQYELKPGDLLFNRTNSSEWVGKTAIYNGEIQAIYAGYLVRVRPLLVKSKYLNSVMNSAYYRSWCNLVKTDAVNQSNINAQKLSQLNVPLPPLSEQHRIVAEIEKWSALIDEIEAGQKDLATLIEQAKSKVLDLAIHGKLVPQDPTDEPAEKLLRRINPQWRSCDTSHYENLPQGWCECVFGDIFQHNNGKQKTSYDQTGKPHKYITTSNVYWEKFDLSEVKEMNFEDAELERCTAKKGDLLVCEGGDIGRAAIWNYEYSICFQNHLHRLRPYVPVETKYFLYVLRDRKCKGLVKGKGIGLLSLSSRELHNIPCPLPPLPEQYRIVAKIGTLFSTLDSISQNMAD